MNENERRILDAVSASIRNMSDIDVAVSLGFAEGLAFMTRDRQPEWAKDGA